MGIRQHLMSIHKIDKYCKRCLNKSMKTFFWLIIAIIVALAIWWIADWHDKHPDGE